MQNSEHKVSLVIDGEVIPLEPNGTSKAYAKFKQPAEYDEKEKSLIVNAYVPLNWKAKVPVTA